MGTKGCTNSCILYILMLPPPFSIDVAFKSFTVFRNVQPVTSWGGVEAPAPLYFSLNICHGYIAPFNPSFSHLPPQLRDMLPPHLSLICLRQSFALPQVEAELQL